MKYLFINSVAGFGSTGRIVAEKCRELMGQGHDCLIAYGRTKVGCDDIPTICIGKPLDYQLHGVRSRIFDDHGFGSGMATKRFLQQVRQYDPDVIWLHNLHGYYIHIGLLFDYLRTCGKKIYWTLHDCWALTGHCAHFTFVGCDRWETSCHDCPQKKNYPASLILDNSRKNYGKKKALFTGIPNMTLVVVSHWLENLVKRSFLREYPVEIVYNQADKAVFYPREGDFRAHYGLEGKLIVLGVANVWDDRKGLKDLDALSSMLDDRFRVVMVGLTQEQIKDRPDDILCLPRTDSTEELAEIYSAADIYVCPSVEETFGMTVLEARLCGTEVIVYSDTACEEVVSLYGGRVVDRGASNIRDAIYEKFGKEPII